MSRSRFCIGLGQNTEAHTSADMLATADEQLHRAKQQGRDQICAAGD
jgi:GGDEF domain-containing protein